MICSHITSYWTLTAYSNRISMLKKYVKEYMESAHRFVSQLLANHTTSGFSVLTSGHTLEQGVPRFLFSGLVCKVGWPLCHAYIFSLWSPSLYHFAFMRAELPNQ